MVTIPVFLSEKFHGQRSLTGYSPWGCKDSDITVCMYVYIYIYIYIFLHIYIVSSEIINYTY